MRTAPLRQWLPTLLLGSAFYAAYHGLKHSSDWYYLAVSSFFAAGASWLVFPLYHFLLRQLDRQRTTWPAAGRWAGLLGSTVATFGLANLLTLPLLTWPGPGSSWPWGMAAVLVAIAGNRPLLRAGPK